MFRRDYLHAIGLVGLAALAGCSAAGASTSVQDPQPRLPTESDYGDWFRGVSNYDATIDRRGVSTITIHVGAPGNMGAFGFDPVAVAVSPDTTVVWEWTGKGGGHNVVADDGSFTSGDLVDASGHTYERRFDAPGIYRYVCEPHRTMGMRGAIVVMTGEPGT